MEWIVTGVREQSTTSNTESEEYLACSVTPHLHSIYKTTLGPLLLRLSTRKGNNSSGRWTCSNIISYGVFSTIFREILDPEFHIVRLFHHTRENHPRKRMAHTMARYEVQITPLLTNLLTTF